ncbi:MAG: hypothetical protein JKY46_05985 [Robiginitomaculum sp.]|nr:hypothetical protein [Robiginitomaculum sp.]
MNTGPIIAMILVALALLAGTVRTVYGYWSVRRDADDEWQDFKRLSPKQAKKTTQQKFVTTYRLAHNPRGLAYSTGALALAVLVTPLAVMILTYFYSVVIVQEIDPNRLPSETLAEEIRRQFRRDGPLVYSFFIFFGLISSWGAVAWVMAWFYHKTDDDEFDESLRITRGEKPLGKIKLKRKRPSWSPLVQTGEGLSLNEAAKKSEQTTKEEKS